MSSTATVPRFYNTLGRSLEPLATREPGRVAIYTCGPTVYNHAHIGNLRTFVFEDLLRRSLRHLGYQVTQVMNLTDVDDKIIRRAVETGTSLDECTEPYIESFFRDLDRLHVERAEQYPRATHHIAEMIELVERLVEKGVAYEADGSIFFRIADDPDYGRLSGFDLSQVRRGERVASDDYDKEDARDFVLWKGAKPGEPSWPSPWGPGRPGWHIECSAMSMKYLGESFDIHAGGVDNIFPHHENEIAQSESATGVEFAHTWLHAEHLIVDGEKMSKSLGNQYTVQELLDRGASPRSLRWLFLSVHYRKKLNFTFAALADADHALKRLDEMRFRLEHASEREAGEGSRGSGEPGVPTATRPAGEGSGAAGAMPEGGGAVGEVSGAGGDVGGGHEVAGGTGGTGDGALGLAAEGPGQADASEGAAPGGAAQEGGGGGITVPAAVETLHADFTAALADDLNISAALAALFVFVKQVNVTIEEGRLLTGDKQRITSALAAVDQVLGVLDPAAWQADTAPPSKGPTDADIDALVARRQAAREAKDWPEADRLRNLLTEHGITVEDTPQGPRWKRG